MSDSTKIKEHNHRPLFSGKLALVFAASASAIGLGNLWRFPALVARYGGGAFLVTYIVIVVTFGFALMMAEIALGRSTKLSVLGAYKKLDKRFSIVGTLAMLVPLIILPYYCVIGGWLIRYAGVYLTGESVAAADGGAFFESFIATPAPVLIATFVFILVTVLIVGLGVKNGIERINSIFMPALFVLTIAIGIYSLTIPGALDGLAFFLIPHFEDFGINTVIAATGQVFFSLSLAMGIMVTYGSYAKKEDNLEKSVRRIEVFDTIVALLAGFMIIPAVFAFSGAAGAEQAGPALMVITMPQVFGGQGFGLLIGFLFFFLVMFAALTSAISLLEAVVSCFVDRFAWPRKTAVLVAGVLVTVLAIFPALGYSVLSGASLTIGNAEMSILDLMDFASNSILMPLVALLTCIIIGYFVKPKFVIDEVESSPGVVFKAKTLFWVMVRYIAPVFLLVILVSSVLNAIGLIQL